MQVAYSWVLDISVLTILGVGMLNVIGKRFLCFLVSSLLKYICLLYNGSKLSSSFPSIRIILLGGYILDTKSIKN